MLHYIHTYKVWQNQLFITLKNFCRLNYKMTRFDLTPIKEFYLPKRVVLSKYIGVKIVLP